MTRCGVDREAGAPEVAAAGEGLQAHGSLVEGSAAPGGAGATRGRPHVAPVLPEAAAAAAAAAPAVLPAEAASKSISLVVGV